MPVEQAVHDDFRVNYFKCARSCTAAQLDWSFCVSPAAGNTLGRAHERTHVRAHTCARARTPPPPPHTHMDPHTPRRTYIANVCRAKAEGAHVSTYFAWSFMDNFEVRSELEDALSGHIGWAL